MKVFACVFSGRKKEGWKKEEGWKKGETGCVVRGSLAGSVGRDGG